MEALHNVSDAQDLDREQNNRERRRKFKPFLPLTIMGNVSSLEESMDGLGSLTRRCSHYGSILKAILIVSTQQGSNFNTSLPGFQAIWADRPQAER